MEKAEKMGILTEEVAMRGNDDDKRWWGDRLRKSLLEDVSTGEGGKRVTDISVWSVTWKKPFTSKRISSKVATPFGEEEGAFDRIVSWIRLWCPGAEIIKVAWEDCMQVVSIETLREDTDSHKWHKEYSAKKKASEES